MTNARVVLAIDPGCCKCGVAVVTRTPSDTLTTLHQGVVNSSELRSTVADLSARFAPTEVIIGNGTTCERNLDLVRSVVSVPIRPVDERYTTVLARRRYFRENPPRGLRRLIPVSLQTPGRPYDDFVAIILAERYLVS